MAGGRVNMQQQHKQTIGRKKSGQLIPQLTACDSDGNAIASDREIGEVPDQRKWGTNNSMREESLTGWTAARAS